MRLIICEEFWPGQRPGVRTGRIETWPPMDDFGNNEVGRITCGAGLFNEVRNKIEGETKTMPWWVWVVVIWLAIQLPLGILVGNWLKRRRK